MSTLKIIQQPECKNTFLRFMIGVPGKRVAQKLVHPVDKTKPAYYVDDNYDVPVFNLLGFGSTMDLARKMADKRAKEIGVRI